jgi:hypothetical protein
MKWLVLVLMLPPLVLSLTQGDLQEVCPPTTMDTAALMGAPLPCLQPVWAQTLARVQRSLQRLQEQSRWYEGLPVP